MLNTNPVSNLPTIIPQSISNMGVSERLGIYFNQLKNQLGSNHDVIHKINQLHPNFDLENLQYNPNDQFKVQDLIAVLEAYKQDASISPIAQQTIQTLLKDADQWLDKLIDAGPAGQIAQNPFAQILGSVFGGATGAAARNEGDGLARANATLSGVEPASPEKIGEVKGLVDKIQTLFPDRKELTTLGNTLKNRFDRQAWHGLDTYKNTETILNKLYTELKAAEKNPSPDRLKDIKISLTRINYRLGDNKDADTKKACQGLMPVLESALLSRGNAPASQSEIVVDNALVLSRLETAETPKQELAALLNQLSNPEIRQQIPDILNQLSEDQLTSVLNVFKRIYNNAEKTNLVKEITQIFESNTNRGEIGKPIYNEIIRCVLSEKINRIAEKYEPEWAQTRIAESFNTILNASYPAMYSSKIGYKEFESVALPIVLLR